MAGSQIERAFNVLESLIGTTRGMSVLELAEQLEIPKSATHRMLSELVRLGYVRQNIDNSRYQLSTKLVAQGFRHMSNCGSDIVQSILDQLAEQTGELVRLGVIEGEQLVWIAKAQGARSGLRYDPDMGRSAPLSSTATGHAWLAQLSDEQALELVARQPDSYVQAQGPNAPRTPEALLVVLARARQQGYAWVAESSSVGTAAIACVLRSPHDRHLIGVLSIAGPSARLSEQRMHELAPELLSVADELSQASQASDLFN